MSPWLGIVGTLLGAIFGFSLSLFKDYLSERKTIKGVIQSCTIRINTAGLPNNNYQYEIILNVIFQNESSVKQPLWDFRVVFFDQNNDPIDLRDDFRKHEPAIIMDAKSTLLLPFKWQETLPISEYEFKKVWVTCSSFKKPHLLIMDKEKMYIKTDYDIHTSI